VLDERVKAILARALGWLASPRLTHAVGEPLFAMFGRPRRPAEIDLAAVRSVLVIRLDEIGDVVMTTPFLRELRRNLPDARITLVVAPETYNLVEHCPYADQVLVHGCGVGGRFGAIRNLLGSLRLARRHFWSQRIDLAILPRWDVDYVHAGFLAYFSGAVYRVGFSEHVSENKRSLNSGFDTLYTHVVNDVRLKHEVRRGLDLITCLGGTIKSARLEFWPRQADEDYARTILRDHGVRPGDRLIGIGPSGGNCHLKQWPAGRFVELGDWLQTECGARIVILGGPADRMLGLTIRSTLVSGAIDLTGKTTLRQAGALLRRCCLYVGGDTGLMHLAAACRTPVVAIFGASCPHRFGPWGPHHRVISALLACGPCHGKTHIDRCGPCRHDEPLCMKSIPVDLVKKVVAEHLVSVGELPAPPKEVPTTDPVLVGGTEARTE
jgi:ADP-heptose:LPS heptosyltransferase